MNRVWLIVTLAILLVLLAGAVWLYNWDIPAPQERIDQELSDDIVTN